MVYVPGSTYTWVNEVDEVDVLPSPRSHKYSVTFPDTIGVNVVENGANPERGVAVKLTVGAGYKLEVVSV